MLSFELKSGNVLEFQKNLELIKPAVSLGGVDSIINAPVFTSHKHVPEEVREKEGITDKVLRLSVGIENVNDLIMDLEKALNHK